MEILFFGLILPIVIGAIVAGNKNRSQAKAILLCLFFGWIGLIVVLCLEDRKVCPECANKIARTALVCHFCGYDIRDQRHKQGPVVPPVE